MISFISSFEIVNVSRFDKSEGRATDPRTFLRIAESVAAAVAVNLNDIKTLLANCLSTFSIKEIQFLVMILKVYLQILLVVLFYIIKFLIILY